MIEKECNLLSVFIQSYFAKSAFQLQVTNKTNKWLVTVFLIGNCLLVTSRYLM